MCACRSRFNAIEQIFLWRQLTAQHIETVCRTAMIKFPRRLGIEFPAAGNTIPKGWEHDSQGLGTRFPRAGNTIPKGTRFPRAGNTIPKGWEHDSPRLALEVPAAGTRSARGWHSMYPRLALDVPAAGTSIARGWQCDCPRPAMRLPRAVAISLPNKKVGDKRLRSAFTSYSFSNGCVDYSVFPSRKSVVEYFTPNGP